MRTNLTGFALTVGMGLIVVLLGLGTLSMAGLISIMPAEAFATEQQIPADEGPVTPRSLVAVATNSKPASAAEASAIAAGDALFKSNCAQCHAVNEKVVGPALAGITKRRSVSWLVTWVQNSARVIASGDEYGVKLFNDNGKQQMPSFPQLSEKDVKDIIAYVSQQQGVPAQESSTAIAYNSTEY
jgi:mono/diheme cytochrome c family protein